MFVSSPTGPLPEASGKKGLDKALATGVASDLLTLADSSEVTVTFMSESAKWQNSLGYFEPLFPRYHSILLTFGTNFGLLFNMMEATKRAQNGGRDG